MDEILAVWGDYKLWAAKLLRPFSFDQWFMDFEGRSFVGREGRQILELHISFYLNLVFIIVFCKICSKVHTIRLLKSSVKRFVFNVKKPKELRQLLTMSSGLL